MWCGLAISNICMNDGLTLLVAAEQSSSRCLLCYERKQVVFEIRWHCLVAAAWRGGARASAKKYLGLWLANCNKN